MPIREYECPECSKVVERIEGQFQSLPNPVCENHFPVVMKRVISVPAQPQFKGSGFYATDYKK